MPKESDIYVDFLVCSFDLEQRDKVYLQGKSSNTLKSDDILAYTLILYNTDGYFHSIIFIRLDIRKI